MNRRNGTGRAFENKKAFIAFITGGDPDIETTEQLIIEIEKAGADLIEIGIPFSDPVAEGSVIQAANMRALSAGVTTDSIFDMVKRVKHQLSAPLVFLTYLNPIYTYGAGRFMKRCRECGVEGLVVPDMPFEEKGELKGICQEYGVEIISMIAPTSEERIAMIAKDAEGFVYCVSSLGVTGVRSEIKTDAAAMIESVRRETDVPCAVGFGIAEAEQASAMAKISDGAIVGSAIVKIIAEYGRESVPKVVEYVRKMKAAVSETYEPRGSD